MRCTLYILFQAMHTFSCHCHGYWCFARLLRGTSEIWKSHFHIKFNCDWIWNGCYRFFDRNHDRKLNGCRTEAIESNIGHHFIVFQLQIVIALRELSKNEIVIIFQFKMSNETMFIILKKMSSLFEIWHFLIKFGILFEF